MLDKACRLHHNNVAPIGIDFFLPVKVAEFSEFGVALLFWESHAAGFVYVMNAVTTVFTL